MVVVRVLVDVVSLGLVSPVIGTMLNAMWVVVLGSMLGVVLLIVLV